MKLVFAKSRVRYNSSPGEYLAPTDEQKNMLVPDCIEWFIGEYCYQYVDRGTSMWQTAPNPARLFRDVRIDSLQQAHFDRYRSRRLAEDAERATIKREMDLVRRAVRAAAARGWCPQLPKMYTIRCYQKQTEALTASEVKRFYAAVRDTQTARYVAIALATGARRSAILELTWDRVNLNRRTINFNVAGLRETREKIRTVVPVSEHLLDLLGARPGREGIVVPIDKQALARRLRIAAEEAHLTKNVTTQTLRRTVATALACQGSVEQAQQMLGHRRQLTTEHYYIRPEAADLRPAMSALEGYVDAMFAAKPPHPAQMYARASPAGTELIKQLARQAASQGIGEAASPRRR